MTQPIDLAAIAKRNAERAEAYRRYVAVVTGDFGHAVVTGDFGIAANNYLACILRHPPSDDIAALLAEVERLRGGVTVDAAKHLPQYAGHIPSPERVAARHTQMARGDWEVSPLVQSTAHHRSYWQASGESCYLCALLHEIDQRRAECERLAGVLAVAERERDALIAWHVEEGEESPPSWYVLVPDRASLLGFGWNEHDTREHAVAAVRAAAGLDVEPEAARPAIIHARGVEQTP